MRTRMVPLGYAANKRAITLAINRAMAAKQPVTGPVIDKAVRDIRAIVKAGG